MSQAFDQEFDEDFKWIPNIEDEKVRAVVDEVYEIAYNPVRGKILNSRHFDFPDTENYRLGRVLRILSRFTPMGGINVIPEEDFDGVTASRGMNWTIEKSDVVGPVYYTFVFDEGASCKELRKKLVDGSHLRTLTHEFRFSYRDVRDHAHGRCDCDHGYEIEYVDSSDGWVEV